MIVAIQQPEHLPWMGYFNKMAQCDLYVYLDNAQYKKRYYENRNRIKTKSGVKWLTVPVMTKGRYLQKINEVLIDNNTPWARKYKGTVWHAYKSYKYWSHIEGIIFPCIDKKYEKLADLNMAILSGLRNYLGIDTPTVPASSLGLCGLKGGSLILEICSRVGAHAYVSGPDGANYLNGNDFRGRNIRLVYHSFLHPEYSQGCGNFLSHMSVVDLIANCGPDSGEIVKKSYKVDINER